MTEENSMLVQTSIFEILNEKESADWKSSVQAVLEEIERKNELPKKSLCIKPNYKKDKETVASYSVCIFEQDYPVIQNEESEASCNTVIMKVTERKDTLDLLVPEQRLEEVRTPVNATIKRIKSDADSVHILLENDDNEMVEFIKQNVEYVLANYTSRADRFCCCDKFIECSNAKKCLHENRLYSLACSYRRNLEKGKIFYGENKNI